MINVCIIDWRYDALQDYGVYRIAGIDFGIRSVDPYFKTYCRGYESDGEPTEFVEVTTADIDEECRFYETENETLRARASLTRIYRVISQKVIDMGGFFLHAAVIEYKGGAIAFIAPSGTGKSTHIKLWRNLLKDNVGIVNGDKPIIMPDGNGGFLAYGTPWAGKECWQRNVAVPLTALCYIYRASIPEIERLSAFDAFKVLLSATIVPEDKDKLEKLLSTVDKLVSSTPAYKLGCNTNVESAILAFETITGEKYAGSDKQ